MRVVQVLYDNLPAPPEHRPDHRFRDGWVFDVSGFTTLFATGARPFAIDSPRGTDVSGYFVQNRMYPGSPVGPAVGWGRPAVIYYSPAYLYGIVRLGDPAAEAELRHTHAI